MRTTALVTLALVTTTTIAVAQGVKSGIPKAPPAVRPPASAPSGGVAAARAQMTEATLEPRDILAASRPPRSAHGQRHACCEVRRRLHTLRALNERKLVYASATESRRRSFR